ncbi:MAG: ABC transporter ATP-binding protein [Candidatus Heimdallarchaeota archaeon]|nr:MAG: ABC transporter ATP-binding protein [Candidatus Heimdallarchaeota archaeon]
MSNVGDREVIVKDVHKYFGKKHVLKGISFHLPDEENLAIIGPNGSGKTTLLRTLASIYLPDKGSIQIGRYDLVTQTREARSLLSYVSPNLSFHKKLTLRETLDYFSSLQGVSWHDQDDLMDKVDLSKMLDSPIEGFSEGQKAMTRFVIALMKKPKILVLDEITATLDVKKKESVIQYIYDLDKKRGLTILLIDHDPSVVDRLCEKLLLMTRDGKVMDYGDTHEIIKQIPYAFDIKVVPNPSIDVNKFVQELGFPYRTMGQLVQLYAETKDEVDEITSELLRRKWKGKEGQEILEFNVSALSMEDIYWHYLLLLNIPIEDRTKGESVGKFS